MRELTIEETKKIELDVLLYIDKICKKHDIKYFLAYGTLIGAVRHKGFIPWDDDIDIQMTRPEYERFISVFEEESKGTKYRLILPDSEESHHSLVKIIDTTTVKTEPDYVYSGGGLGVDVDVFVIDGTPSDDKEYVRFYKKLSKIYLRHIYSLSFYGRGLKNFLKKVRKFLYVGFHKPEYFIKKAEALHAKYPYEKCDMVGSIVSYYNGIKNRVKKEWFECPYVEVDFEGYKFPAPGDYDKILTAIFGDYMTPPPADKQVAHHVTKVYVKGE